MRYQIINERKRALNLTNAQLAEKSGVTLSTLDKITSGANDNPKLTTLQAIARVIGCTLDDFDDQVTASFSEEALAFARRYDALDYYGRQAVKAIMEIEYERCVNPLSRLDARQKEIIDRWDAEDDATVSGEA
jgi:transcriptional regulator with XRE-family HTH domain